MRGNRDTRETIVCRYNLRRQPANHGVTRKRISSNKLIYIYIYVHKYIIYIGGDIADQPVWIAVDRWRE